MPEFLSLTELGQIYGVSRNKVGQWLVDLGLRTQEKKPSRAAFNGGFVDQRPSTQPATYFYVWHARKTCELLDGAGYMRAEPAQGKQKARPTLGVGLAVDVHENLLLDNYI